MTTLKLLVWLLPISVNIYADRNGAKRNYLIVNILRGMCMILHGAMFIDSYEGYWYYWWPVIVFELTSYWILFDIGVNYFQKRKEFPNSWILYYDKKEGDSGWVDRIFKWLGPVAHATAKMIALAAMIFSIILIYKRDG